MKITLKDQLKTIKSMHYKVPESENLHALGLEMLKRVGDPDPELRDDLIYGIMSKWIIGEVFDETEMKAFLKVLLDEEHLTYGLGHVDDRTLIRSFSILHLVLLVYRHVKNPYLSKEDIDHIYTGILTVAAEEQDLRGYDEEKGWFHLVAHLADLLDEMIYVTSLTDQQLFGILKVVQFFICKDTVTFVDFEEERMAEVVLSLVKSRRLEHAQIHMWLEGFTAYNKDLEMPEKNRVKKNVKGFLQACYFKLYGVEGTDLLLQKISGLCRQC